MAPAWPLVPPPTTRTVIVYSIAKIKRPERSGNGRLVRIAGTKIRLDAFTIDGDIAITIGEEAHAGYSRLAPSHTIVILTFDGFGQGRFLLFFTLPHPTASTKPPGQSRELVSGPHADELGQHRSSSDP